MSADREVAEVLTAHRRREVWEPPGNMIGWGCHCGWGDEGGYALPFHDEHLAEALAPLIAARERAAAERAWNEGYIARPGDAPRYKKTSEWGNPYRMRDTP